MRHVDAASHWLSGEGVAQAVVRGMIARKAYRVMWEEEQERRRRAEEERKRKQEEERLRKEEEERKRREEDEARIPRFASTVPRVHLCTVCGASTHFFCSTFAFPLLCGFFDCRCPCASSLCAAC